MNAVVHLQSTYSVSITTSYLFLKLTGGSVKAPINFGNYIYVPLVQIGFIGWSL